jgi:hypothetical protein
VAKDLWELGKIKSQVEDPALLAPPFGHTWVLMDDLDSFFNQKNKDCLIGLKGRIKAAFAMI